MEKISEKYKKIDAFFHKVSKHLLFSLINPVNNHLIKKDFFKTYKNPYLIYKENGAELLDYKNKLRSLRIKKDSPISYLLNKKKLELIKKIDLINSRGTEDFTKNSLRLYGKPNKDLINKAKRILKLKDGIKSRKILIKEAISMIKESFNNFGFKWQIKKEHIISSALLIPSEKTLYLKKKARFSEEYVKRLIVHEIGTHALRAENAKQQPLKIFFHGLDDYLATEEGLAVYNEERNNLLDINILKNYAGRVIAVNLALKNSFYDTFKGLRKYFNTETAFKLTLRVKRGLADTSKKGGFTKDYVYLKGYFDVKDFVENHGSIKDLYYGKISIKDVSIINKLKPYLKEPRCFMYS
jgi:uncharacterized protein (TIGR02421 family)